jgi:hypothetical protein
LVGDVVSFNPTLEERRVGSSLSREAILAAIRAAVEPKPFVNAMWEGGAASFGRLDAYSDIDLQLDVEDDHVTEVVAMVDATLAALSPIDLRYELPQPTWHGHHQVFYRLADAGRFLLVDFVVMRQSNAKKFLEREIHGQPLVHFDRKNVTAAPVFDREALAQRLRSREASLRTTFDLFQSLVEKEVLRGNGAEAVAFYHAFTLRPLVEVLRIRHCPARHDFHLRYIRHDLPKDVAPRVERLAFATDLGDLESKWREAGRWFRELTAGS